MTKKTLLPNLLNQPPINLCGCDSKCFEPREDIDQLCKFLESDMETCKKTGEKVRVYFPCPWPTR